MRALFAVSITYLVYCLSNNNTNVSIVDPMHDSAHRTSKLSSTTRTKTYYVNIVDPMCVSDPRDVSLGVVAYKKGGKHISSMHIVSTMYALRSSNSLRPISFCETVLKK
jgi:hypothetical protein